VQSLLDMGIDYTVLGSLLLKDPEGAFDIIDSFPLHVIAGVDTKNDFVAVEGWLESSDVASTHVLDMLSDKPVAAIIYTDIDRDGMMLGPNIEALQRVAQHTSIPVIASGGVRSLADVSAVQEYASQGVAGCIIGKAILSGALALDTLWS